MATFKNRWLVSTFNKDTGLAYHYFLSAAGTTALAASPLTTLPTKSVVQIPCSAAEYLALALPDAPQPSRSEQVDVLPPPIPANSVLGSSPFNLPASIAFDATSNSGINSAVSSVTWAHTCGASTNLLIVGDSHDASGGNDYTVLSVTYNSSSLTFVRSDVNTASDKGRTSIFFRYAPTTGSPKNIVVTYGGTIYDASPGAVSLAGAAQSGQPDAHNGTHNTTGNPSVAVVTVANNSWVFSVVSPYIGGNGLSACGQTQRWLTLGYFGGSDTNGPVTPAGSQTMSWTQAAPGTYGWAISAASFKPISGNTYSCSISEGFGSGESFVPVRKINLALAEGVKGSETINPPKTAKPSIGDGLSLANLSTLLRTSKTSNLEGLSTGDLNAPQKTAKPSLSESASIADLESVTRQTYPSIAEVQSVSDSFGLVKTLIASTLDGLRLGEGQSGIRNLVLALLDILSDFDGSLPARTSTASVGETNNIGEGVSISRASYIQALDSLSYQDEPAIIKAANLSLVESTGIADGIGVIRQVFQSLAEGRGISEAAALVRTINLRLSDGASLDDLSVLDALAILAILKKYVGGSRLPNRGIGGSQLGNLALNSRLPGRDIGGSKLGKRDVESKLPPRDIGGSEGI